MNPEEFFNSLIDYEKIPGYDYKLEDFIEFLTQFDSPQKRLNNLIHIAGTKGKGSTAAMISSCLEACGYRVGLFTSPHLERINERIKINSIEISNHQLNKYIEEIRPYINMKTRVGARPVKYRKLPGAPPIKHHEFHGARTYFEILTTIAFLHFLKKKTDFTILEVGLGGRLDSTNVTNPIISVITRIGYDHTNLLGNRLSQITREKAGIIKNCGKLITIKQRPTVQEIIEKTCRAKSCSLSLAESQHDIKIVRPTIKGSHLKTKGEIGKFNTFLPLPGKHQVENLLIALAVINELGKMGFKIPVPAIQKGIRQTDLHGRFEIISPKNLVPYFRESTQSGTLRERAKRPLIIFDCAHNQDSFEALGKNLNLINTKDLYLIFATNKDKDIRYCLKYIFPRAKEVLLVKSDNPRAMEPIDLYERAKKYQKNLIVAPSVQKVIEYIKTKTHHNPTILITGSFYLWQPTW